MMEQHTENRIQINQQDDEVEIDLLELFFFYRSRWIPILAMFVAGAVIAGLITIFLITPLYQATSKLYVVSASTDSVVNLMDLNLGTSLSLDYEELLKIRPLFEEVIEEEKLPYQYEELLNMITITNVEDTRILFITVTSPKPEEAQGIANALADKAVSYLPDLMEISPPNIAEYAILPKVQSSPSLVKNVVIGALIGMVIMLAILTVRYVMDDTLKSAEDVEKNFGIMPLAVVPEGHIEELSDKREHEKLEEKRRRRRRSRLSLWQRKLRRRKRKS